jgi:DNA replication protein DnaC
MTDAVRELLKAHLKQLRLPAMVQELEALSREAAASNQNYEQFLLRLTEVELAARAANALQSRIVLGYRVSDRSPVAFGGLDRVKLPSWMASHLPTTNSST